MKKLLLFALGVLAIGSVQAFSLGSYGTRVLYGTKDRTVSKELEKCALVDSELCNGINCPPAYYHDVACVNKLQKKYPGKIYEISRWSPNK